MPPTEALPPTTLSDPLPVTVSFHSLQSLNDLQELAVKAARDAVCDFEQNASDAADQGNYQLAQMYKQWAFGAQVASFRVSESFTAAFTAAFEEWEASAGPVLTDHTEVELPNLDRSASARVVPMRAVRSVK